jgi:hypothetical protein
MVDRATAMATRDPVMAMPTTTTVRSITAVVVAGVLGATAVSLTAAERSSASGAPAGPKATADAHLAGAFSWLIPARAPQGWTSATIASGGATLHYPPNWKAIPGDPGTITAALRDKSGRYRGYLNVTPREGAEQLAGWGAFRTARNANEGDGRVRVLAAAENLRFAEAHGSCVIDDYLSRVGSHPYREVACLVAGNHYTSVFVGAVLRSDWPTIGPVVERAGSALIER